MKSFSKVLRKMAAETTDRDVSRAAEQTADSIDLEEADNERKKRERDIPIIYRSQCECPCHKPGMRILHCLPCCYPDSMEKKNETDSPTRIDIRSISKVD